MKFKVKDLSNAIEEISVNQAQQQQLNQLFNKKNEEPKKPFLYFFRNVFKILTDSQRKSFNKKNSEYTELSFWVGIEEILQLDDKERQEVDRVYSNVVSRGASFQWFIEGLYESKLNSDRKVLITDAISQNKATPSRTKRKFSTKSEVTENDSSKSKPTKKPKKTQPVDNNDLSTELYDDDKKIKPVNPNIELSDSEKNEIEDEVIEDEEESSDEEVIFDGEESDKNDELTVNSQQQENLFSEKDAPLTNSARDQLHKGFRFSDSDSDQDLKDLKRQLQQEREKQENIQKQQEQKTTKKIALEEKLAKTQEEIAAERKAKLREDKKQLLLQQLNAERSKTASAKERLTQLEHEINEKQEELQELTSFKVGHTFNSR